MRRGRWWIVGGALGVVLVAAAFLLLRGDDVSSPRSAAAAFAEAWSTGDTAGMQQLIVDQDRSVAEDLERLAGGLRVAEQRHELIGEVERGEDGARATFRSTYLLAGLGEWSYDHVVAIERVDAEDRDWGVVWNDMTVHPDLAGELRLRSTRTWPDRAPILGADGEPIAGPHDAVVVGVEPRRITDLAALTTALEEALGVTAEDVTEALEAPGVEPDHFVPLATLRRPAYEAVRDSIRPVPGTVFRETTERGPPTPEFARHLIGRVGEITAERLEELGAPYVVGDVVGLSGLEAAYEGELAGEPSGTVELVRDTGDGTERISVLRSFEGRSPEPLRTTIEPSVQAAVERTLDGRTEPVAVVAVDEANRVLAVASRPLGELNRALLGRYPPGSTFKIVTAAALLADGVTATSTLECPATIEVDGRRFSNYEGEALGQISFEDAFVHSCNTAFVASASGLPEGALVAAAEDFGFGIQYSLGTAVARSEVPAPTGPVERAATAIGQGRVLATPLHMATVASAVIDGSWEQPTLVLRDEPSGAVLEPLSPAARSTLEAFMAGVVDRGTAVAARAVEGLRGKTGTAEFGTETPPRTHAWFVGFRGDLAVAVLLEDGGVGGQDAAPVAADLFRNLDGG